MVSVVERMGECHYPKTIYCDFIVDPAKCNTCKKCVSTCPGQLLRIVDNVPSIKAAEDAGMGCIGCRNCIAVCENGAIEVRDYYRVLEGPYKTLLNPPRLPNPLGSKIEEDFESIAGQLTETERVIYRRRSNRLFKKKPVPPQILRRIVEAGRFAPSAGNCQPWAFIIIQDRKLLDEIVKECLPILKMMPSIYFRNSGNRAIEKGRSIAVNVLSRLTPNNFDQRLIYGIDTLLRYKDWDMFLHSSSVIIILGDKRGVGDPKLDCGICGQNMVLAAHSLGLGTCYVGFSKIINFRPPLKKKLGIKWPYEVVTSVAVGYPRGPQDKAVAREVPQLTWFPADGSGPMGGI